MAMINGSDTVAPTEPAAAAAATPTAAKKKVVKLVPKAKPKVKRVVVQSTISFPYRDLESGIAVAQAIHNAGAVALSTDQLAGVMGLQAGSGNFVLKVMTARIFGLVTYTASKYELTDLGFEITEKDDKRQKAAKAKAFLMTSKGGNFPRALALNRPLFAMASLSNRKRPLGRLSKSRRTKPGFSQRARID